MSVLAEVVRVHAQEYLRRFGEAMPPRHRRALADIQACHTAQMGGHRYHCDDCGTEHFRYHSCRNRLCPSCGAASRQEWVAARLADVLPCRYFHLVFTVPAELRRLIRSNQAVLLDALMRAAAESLQQLAADPDQFGGRIGILQVLHTWGGQLEYHPHVHCLVPGGALRSDGRVWTSRRSDFFLSVRALSKLFRARFLERARATLQQPLPRLPKRAWVVYCADVVQGPEKVIGYLGRYINRTAIGSRSITRHRDGRLTFGYRDHRSGRHRKMTLPALEFLRRLLQHVLPRGFHQVRYLGLLHPGARAVLRRLQLVLWQRAGRLPPTPDPRPPSAIPCPACGSHRTTLVAVNHRARSPPASSIVDAPPTG